MATSGTASNEQELINMVQPSFKEAMGYLIEDLIANNRDIIESVVYDGNDPDEYERTMQFLDSFDSITPSAVALSGDEIASGAFGYTGKGVVSSEPWYHQSFSNKTYGQPSVEELVDIIYKGNKGMIPTPPRNAYEEFNRWLSKKRMKYLFEWSMKKSKIEWKRSTGGLEKKNYKKL